MPIWPRRGGHRSHPVEAAILCTALNVLMMMMGKRQFIMGDACTANVALFPLCNISFSAELSAVSSHYFGRVDQAARAVSLPQAAQLPAALAVESLPCS